MMEKEIDFSHRIRIALQKSGQLSENSLDLLISCGLKVGKSGRKLYSHCKNFPLDIFFVRDDDIPYLTQCGFCDLGIVGSDILHEKSLISDIESSKKFEKLLDLGFGACDLSIAVPKTFSYKDIDVYSLSGKRIATSYPLLLEKYLRSKGIKAEILVLTGAIEVAPYMGIADVICDLVETGSTLKAHNLIDIETIFKSQAVLIKTTKLLTKKKEININVLHNKIVSVLQNSSVV